MLPQAAKLALGELRHGRARGAQAEVFRATVRSVDAKQQAVSPIQFYVVVHGGQDDGALRIGAAGMLDFQVVDPINATGVAGEYP